MPIGLGSMKEHADRRIPNTLLRILRVRDLRYWGKPQYLVSEL